MATMMDLMSALRHEIRVIGRPLRRHAGNARIRTGALVRPSAGATRFRKKGPCRGTGLTAGEDREELTRMSPDTQTHTLPLALMAVLILLGVAALGLLYYRKRQLQST